MICPYCIEQMAKVHRTNFRIFWKCKRCGFEDVTDLQGNSLEKEVNEFILWIRISNETGGQKPMNN